MCAGAARVFVDVLKALLPTSAMPLVDRQDLGAALPAAR
ncbi:Hypothetical protein A7982_04538 [Minicystis rosea]|nr:Hypothetical protein A7982_04538 [Minicystis rosea]